jgi:septal ring factor EnvC (AmiA/AmiB activator)
MRTLTLVTITFLLVSLSLFAGSQQIVAPNPDATRATDLEKKIQDLKDQLLALNKRETDEKKAIEDANSKLKQANLELKQVGAEQDNATEKLKKLETELASLNRAEKKRIDAEKRALKEKQ